jgi:hypothetical protein
MKKFRCLLLDAGPIIELHRLKLWGRFLECCEVTVARTVAEDEAQFTGEGLDKEHFDFTDDIAQNRIQVVDLDLPVVAAFRKTIPIALAQVDPGELVTLAFLVSQDLSWKVCAADNAVFRVLGYLGRGGQGISLEEILKEIGLEQNLKKQFTKNFRKDCTKQGEAEGIQRGSIY